jgi:endoglucanase
MQRRDFLKTAALGAAAALTGTSPLAAASKAAIPSAQKLPQWRGFNLLEKFYAKKPFAVSDFQWISEWGFDFVRLPMDYLVWTDAADPSKLDEKQLADVDQAVEMGKKYGIHVCLNLHHAPGYTVNAAVKEKLNLWKDEEAQKQFDFQWANFAKRYQGIPSKQLSFDLVNEPNNKVAPEAYAKVMTRATKAIHAVDPSRLVICDGLAWGTKPVPELAGAGVAQSTRGYAPMQITHYKASWIGGSDRWPAPTWPLHVNGKTTDRQSLFHDCIEPWKKLEAQGVGVHVGEWGAFNKTPHETVLAWARDFLGLWKEAGWGWAMWNFRGGFGIVDSQRADVAYEDFKGHKLDRKFLSLLQQF